MDSELYRIKTLSRLPKNCRGWSFRQGDPLCQIWCMLNTKPHWPCLPACGEQYQQQMSVSSWVESGYLYAALNSLFSHNGAERWFTHAGKAESSAGAWRCSATVWGLVAKEVDRSRLRGQTPRSSVGQWKSELWAREGFQSLQWDFLNSLRLWVCKRVMKKICDLHIMLNFINVTVSNLVCCFHEFVILIWFIYQHVLVCDCYCCLQPSRYHLPRSDNYTLLAYRSSDLKSAHDGKLVKKQQFALPPVVARKFIILAERYLSQADLGIFNGKISRRIFGCVCGVWGIFWGGYFLWLKFMRVLGWVPGYPC